jgi:DNA repair protein RadD
MITLRPDQLADQQQAFDHWRAGARNVMIVKPTGGGKSIEIADTVRQFDGNRQQTLVMAHRRELVGQMSLHVARQGVRHRIIAPKDVVSAIMAEHRRELNGQSFINPSALCAVGGVDTIVSRLDQLSDYLRALDLLVCDEGHHVQKANKWGHVFAACQRALGLLVTATPQRADGHGLGRGNLVKPAILDQYGRPITPAEYDGDGVVDVMVCNLQMRELIDMGALTDYEIVCPPSDFDLDSLRIGESGDVTQASMKAASEKSHIVGDVVENYIKYAFGKRAVCFATDVATSAKIAAQFNAWGIPAASISAETDSGVRDDVIRRLRDGRLWVVCNVDLLGEGFDLPAIECVIMARPTASLAVYMQQFGRALRPMPGKLFGLVIDHVSNIKRFGFPDRPRVWSLDRRQKRAAKEKDPELVDVLICPNTGRPYEAIHIAACPHCKQADGVTPGNHTKPAGAGGSVRAIEVVAGDLTRLTADQLAELRKAMQLPDPNAVVDPRWSGGVQAGQRNIAFANIQAQRELQEAIAEWAGYQKHGLGRDDSELFRRFYHATGLDVLSALAGSRQDMIAMTERVRGWLTMAA